MQNLTQIVDVQPVGPNFRKIKDMSFYATQIDASFFLAEEDNAAALNAVRELTKTNKEFDWLRQPAASATDLESVLLSFGWLSESDGDIYHIELSSPIGDDLAFFNAIAPFVKKDSYLLMRGEDGFHWQWLFNGETCVEEPAMLIYNPAPGIEAFNSFLSKGELPGQDNLTHEAGNAQILLKKLQEYLVALDAHFK